MTKTHLPFAPLTADVDDAELERLARDKGVGTYDAPPAPPRLREVPAELPNSAEQPVPNQLPTPRSLMKKVNLELPDYAWTELKIRAAQRQTSLRHVVMSSLVADGITIAEIDMVEDGRRDR